MSTLLWASVATWAIAVAIKWPAFGLHTTVGVLSLCGLYEDLRLPVTIQEEALPTLQGPFFLLAFYVGSSVHHYLRVLVATLYCKILAGIASPRDESATSEKSDRCALAFSLETLTNWGTIVDTEVLEGGSPFDTFLLSVAGSAGASIIQVATPCILAFWAHFLLSHPRFRPLPNVPCFYTLTGLVMYMSAFMHFGLTRWSDTASNLFVIKIENWDEFIRVFQIFLKEVIERCALFSGWLLVTTVTAEQLALGLRVNFSRDVLYVCVMYMLLNLPNDVIRAWNPASHLAIPLLAVRLVQIMISVVFHRSCLSRYKNTCARHARVDDA